MERALLKDKALRWRLVAAGLAQGLRFVGESVLKYENEEKAVAFAKDTDLLLEWIERDDLDALYTFFCAEGEGGEG